MLTFASYAACFAAAFALDKLLIELVTENVWELEVLRDPAVLIESSGWIWLSCVTALCYFTSGVLFPLITKTIKPFRKFSTSDVP